MVDEEIGRGDEIERWNEMTSCEFNLSLTQTDPPRATGTETALVMARTLHPHRIIPESQTNLRQ